MVKLTKAEQYTALAAALRDFNTYQEINQIQIDMIYNSMSAGVEIPFGYTRSYIYINEGIIVVYGTGCNSSYKLDYDTILETKGVNIGPEGITVQKAEVKVLRNGITIKADAMFGAEIPEDEMATLELLGKVNVETIPAQMSTTKKTVFCPTGMGLPF